MRAGVRHLGAMVRHMRAAAAAGRGWPRIWTERTERVLREENWAALAQEYITGQLGLNALAAKYAIPRSTLKDHAARGRWQERREAYREAKQLCELDRENESDALLRVTEKLLRRAEEIADNADEMGARELGELMRALKSASVIRQTHGAAESEDDEQSCLRIVFSPETEEAAQ